MSFQFLCRRAPALRLSPSMTYKVLQSSETLKLCLMQGRSDFRPWNDEVHPCSLDVWSNGQTMRYWMISLGNIGHPSLTWEGVIWDEAVWYISWWTWHIVALGMWVTRMIEKLNDNIIAYQTYPLYTWSQLFTVSTILTHSETNTHKEVQRIDHYCKPNHGIMAWGYETCSVARFRKFMTPVQDSHWSTGAKTQSTSHSKSRFNVLTFDIKLACLSFIHVEWHHTM